jgi:GAF domain-containing protein
MHSSPTSLADILTAAADSMHQVEAVPELLSLIVLSARDTIPGAEYAGISLAHRPGRIETVAATDPLVHRVDQLQYDLDEGPCVDAIKGHKQAWTNHLSTDDRWPHFGPRAGELGIESQMGIELFNEPRSLGGLNLYSTRGQDFNHDTPHIAVLFATHAAHALGKSVRDSQLNEALSSRKAIGIALGLVMERYELSEQRAFAFLIRASQQSNTKLRHIATQMVVEADRRGDQGQEPRHI